MEGLEALRAAGARVPQVVSLENNVLLLENLSLQRAGDYAEMARMLATVHRTTGPRYGWPRDNFIGLGEQRNGWCDDWAEFFLERRLKRQLLLAERNGFLFEPLAFADLLKGHQPPPSLLHGDLWSGNAGFVDGEPVVFDPAVYYGDRECDLAMTELFGGFPREFYSAYPMQPGYERRKHVYNLYHLLNHLNIFGGGYLGQVESALRLLRGLLQ